MNSREGDWVPQADSNPEYSAVEQLSATETGLIRYTFSIVKEFKEKIKMRLDQEILDFGAGIGFLPKLFRDNYQINSTFIGLDTKLRLLVGNKSFQASNNINIMRKNSPSIIHLFRASESG